MSVAVDVTGGRCREERQRPGRFQPAQHPAIRARVDQDTAAGRGHDIRDAVAVDVAGGFETRAETIAWRAVRHIRSNAIVLARNAGTVGIGAAQASRQVSVEIALRRAGDRAKLAVMASDAYFPFPDGIQMAAQAGVTAIIQPGGSARDEMAIEVADRHHLAMVFTGRRHFRH